ncbi:MAG: thiamine phosphate synthase, partial [Bryobacteraceae bacterium]
MILPRFYPILDTAACRRAGLALREAAAAILESGVGILQLRHKGSFTRDLFETATVISGLCRHYGATFIVNDRADVAALLEAGVHLGQEDLPVAETRKLLP